MTDETSEWLKQFGRNNFERFLLVLLAASVVHFVDVLTVKDRVDMIQAAHILNTQWRIESEEAIKKLRRRDDENMITWLNGQRVILKCLYKLKHGEEDRECDWQLWRAHASERDESDGSH